MVKLKISSFFIKYRIREQHVKTSIIKHFCIMPVPPEIQDDGQSQNLTVTLRQPLTLGCDAFGIPSPTITWSKDGHSVSLSP